MHETLKEVISKVLSKHLQARVTTETANVTDKGNITATITIHPPTIKIESLQMQTELQEEIGKAMKVPPEFTGITS